VISSYVPQAAKICQDVLTAVVDKQMSIEVMFEWSQQNETENTFDKKIIMSLEEFNCFHFRLY
jgi:hypothetical protein